MLGCLARPTTTAARFARCLDQTTRTQPRVNRFVMESEMSSLAPSMDGNHLYCWTVKDGEHHLAIIDPRIGQVIHLARIDRDPSTPQLSDALGVVILYDLEQGSVSIHDAETLARVASVQLEGDARLPVLAPASDQMYVSHVDSEWIDVIELGHPPEPATTATGGGNGRTSLLVQIGN
jgi:hypothetical protein